MNSLTIQTEFNNRAYVPGDLMEGRVSWQLTEASDMVLRLFYYTDGKGTRDVVIVDQHQYPYSMRGEGTFKFQLPNGPFSFSGQLVSLIWALELKPIKEDEPTERLEFVLSPTGQEIDLYAYAEDGE